MAAWVRHLLGCPWTSLVQLQVGTRLPCLTQWTCTLVPPRRKAEMPLRKSPCLHLKHQSPVRAWVKLQEVHLPHQLDSLVCCQTLLAAAGSWWECCLIRTCMVACPQRLPRRAETAVPTWALHQLEPVGWACLARSQWYLCPTSSTLSGALGPATSSYMRTGTSMAGSSSGSTTRTWCALIAGASLHRPHLRPGAPLRHPRPAWPLA